MLKRATYTGKDDVLSAFETLYENGYCYSVWASERDIAFQYPHNDHDKGAQYFENNLAALEQAGNDDLFYLKLHPAVKPKEFIDKKTTVICTIPFRVKSLKDGELINGVGEHSGNSYRMFEAIEAIKSLPAKMDERQTAFEERMLALLDDPGEITGVVPVIDPLEKYVTMAIGALQQPNVMQNITGIIKMFIPNFNPQMTQQPQQQPASISGTANEAPAPVEVDINKLDQALQRLAKHCRIDEDLTKLADLADNNPAYFTMMLTSLRAAK